MITTLVALTLARSGPIDPWPVERQDRYGTSQAIMGMAPDQYYGPWRYIDYGNTFISSHGPSFDANGVGYFGQWVNNVLYRFDANTGAITGAVAMGNFVACTPAIGATEIIARTDAASGIVAGVNRSGFFLDWVNNTGYTTGSPMLGPEGDVVYCQKNGVLTRVLQSNGTTVWSHSGISNPVGTVVFLRDDSAVVLSHGNIVSAYDWATGNELWSYDSGSTAGPCGVAPDGTVVFGNNNGRVIGLDHSGNLLWTRFTTGMVDAPPAFGLNGEVYIGSHDYAFYAFRTNDGLPLWSYVTSNWISQAALVDNNGRVYLHNRTGQLYCFTPDGNLIWLKTIGNDARGPMSMSADGTLYVPYANTGPSGLVAIRQDRPVVHFTLTSLNSEMTSSGSATALDSIDGDELELSSDANGSATYCEAEFEGTVPKAQLDTMHLEMNLHMFGANVAVAPAAWIYDNSTNSWKPVPINARVNTNPRTYNLDFGSMPSNAVEAGTNKIRVKLHFERKSRAHPQWGILMDELSGYVNPTF